MSFCSSLSHVWTVFEGDKIDLSQTSKSNWVIIGTREACVPIELSCVREVSLQAPHSATSSKWAFDILYLNWITPGRQFVLFVVLNVSIDSRMTYQFFDNDEMLSAKLWFFAKTVHGSG